MKNQIAPISLSEKGREEMMKILKESPGKLPRVYMAGFG